jgi:hypothetical protein
MSKMRWQYRVVNFGSDEFPNWSIRQVRFNSKGEPSTVDQDGATPYGDTRKRMEKELSYMQLALTLPVVRFGDINTDEEDIAEAFEEHDSGQLEIEIVMEGT